MSSDSSSMKRMHGRSGAFGCMLVTSALAPYFAGLAAPHAGGPSLSALRADSRIRHIVKGLTGDSTKPRDR